MIVSVERMFLEQNVAFVEMVFIGWNSVIQMDVVVSSYHFENFRDLLLNGKLENYLKIKYQWILGRAWDRKGPSSILPWGLL